MESIPVVDAQRASLLTSTFALTSIACLIYFAYRWALPRPIPGIPYDKAAAKSIFGDLPQMISYTKKHGVMIPWMTGQNAKHNAPLVQIFLTPLGKPALVLSDFQESQDVLVRRGKEFDRADITLATFTGIMPDHHIAMKTADPRFKGNKELVRDLMSPNFLQDVSAAQIFEKSLALIDLWSYKAKVAGGRPFAARQDIFDAAMDIINAAAFAFGDELSIIKRQLNYLVSKGDKPFPSNPDGSVEFPRRAEADEIDALHVVAGFLGNQMTSPSPKLTFYFRWLSDAKLRRSMVAKDEVIKNQIRQSLERFERGDKTQHSATDFMIQREYSVAKKEGRAPEFFSRRTLDELFGYIVAGHETSSSTLSWVLKLIADHQPIQAKLQQTLREAFPAALSESRQLTAQEIGKVNIPYLDAVLEECIRVGSPTPMLARESIVDTVLLGHRVPKGTALLINTVGPDYHSKAIPIPDSVRSDTARTKHWGGAWNPEDPHVFNPDRWLKVNDNGEVVYDAQAGPFLSFGMGPRGCFGKRLAYMEMRMVLTLLLWNFRFKKLEGELALHDTIESVTVMPKHCFVALEQVKW